MARPKVTLPCPIEVCAILLNPETGEEHMALLTYENLNVTLRQIRNDASSSPMVRGLDGTFELDAIILGERD